MAVDNDFSIHIGGDKKKKEEDDGKKEEEEEDTKEDDKKEDDKKPVEEEKPDEDVCLAKVPPSMPQCRNWATKDECINNPVHSYFSVYLLRQPK